MLWLVRVLLLLAVLTVIHAAPGRGKKKKKVPAFSVGVGRIAGGVVVKISDFPYQLSLQYNGGHVCGASIIGRRWALTAAHCSIFPVQTLVLRSGNVVAGQGPQHKVETLLVHPLYNQETFDYDVALIKVKKAFKVRSNIPLIGFGVTVDPGTNSTVSGWGIPEEGGNAEPKLLAVSIPTISRESCQNSYNDVNNITERMLCAHEPRGGKDACQHHVVEYKHGIACKQFRVKHKRTSFSTHDSGGPLVALLGGVKQQIAVVSWGYGCARPEYPGVYTNIANLRNWIQTTTGNEV